MIELSEGNISMIENKVFVIGKSVHKPLGSGEEEWMPYEGEFSISNLTDLYAALGLLLLSGRKNGDKHDKEGREPEGNRSENVKPDGGAEPNGKGRRFDVWRIYSRDKSSLALYPPKERYVSRKFLAFLIASSFEEKKRTRFPLSDINVGVLMHEIEKSVLRGEHSCIFSNENERILTAVRKPSELTLITENCFAEVDVYTRSMLLQSVERVIHGGEVRPFKRGDVGCRNGTPKRNIPMLQVRGDLFRIDLPSALKLKLLCQ